MERLAVAIPDDCVTQGNALAVPVSTRVADQLYRGRGEPVLAYVFTAENRPAFIALAEVSGLLLGQRRDEVKAVLSLSRRFAVPRFAPSMLRSATRPQSLRLTADQFTGVLAQDESDALVAAEASTPFVTDRASLDAISAVYHRTLEDFDFRCPFTEQVSAGSSGINPMLHVEPIIPLHAEGTLAPGNLLVMSLGVLAEWRQGHLTLADDLRFVCKAGMAPDVMQSLRPEGRLRLPRSGTAPSPESLAFHRRIVCGL